MNQNFMKEKPVMPLVISMALPMTLSMLVNALYNIVDSYFVASMSEDAMTALSLVYPIQNLVIAVIVGFGIGVNAMIAYYTGAGEQKLADHCASMGVFLNAIHGILLTIFCIGIMPYFLSMFTGKEEIIKLGIDYSNVVFLFVIPNSIAISFEKIFQSVGRMKGFLSVSRPTLIGLNRCGYLYSMCAFPPAMRLLRFGVLRLRRKAYDDVSYQRRDERGKGNVRDLHAALVENDHGHAA